MGLHEALLACYPRAWRERYGAEFAEVVAREGRSPRVAFDLLRGVVDAHLHPQVGEVRAGRGRRVLGVALLAATLAAAGVAGQQPGTARAVAALLPAPQGHAGVATATLTEYGHSQGGVRPE